MNWKELGGCVSDDVNDKTWITEPSPFMAVAMAAICQSCDVFADCKANADEFQVSGVFQAGTWRD